MSSFNKERKLNIFRSYIKEFFKCNKGKFIILFLLFIFGCIVGILTCSKYSGISMNDILDIYLISLLKKEMSYITYFVFHIIFDCIFILLMYFFAKFLICKIVLFFSFILCGYVFGFNLTVIMLLFGFSGICLTIIIYIPFILVIYIWKIIMFCLILSLVWQYKKYGCYYNKIYDTNPFYIICVMFLILLILRFLQALCLSFYNIFIIVN